MRRVGSTPAQRGSATGQTCPDIVEMDRVGSTPVQRGSTSGANCPDVVRREDGDFIVVGRFAHLTVSEWARLRELEVNASPDEAMVVVPRQCFMDAVHQIMREEMTDDDSSVSRVRD